MAGCSATAGRDALIEAHLPQVSLAVRTLGRRCPPHEREEMFSAGCLGIVDAARRFDPSRGLQFSTLAWHRITGAILDDRRRRLKQVGYTRTYRQVAQFVPLDEHDAETPPNAFDRVLRRERLELLRSAPLQRIDRRILLLLVRGWTMKRIGEEFGVCESRISQRVTAMTATLRAYFQERCAA